MQATEAVGQGMAKGVRLMVGSCRDELNNSQELANISETMNEHLAFLHFNSDGGIGSTQRIKGILNGLNFGVGLRDNACGNNSRRRCDIAQRCFKCIG